MPHTKVVHTVLRLFGLALLLLALTGCELAAGTTIEIAEDGSIIIRDADAGGSSGGVGQPVSGGGQGVSPVITGSSGLTASGGWWQLMFTDPATNDRTVINTLIDYINNAERSILIAAFEFNLTEVAEALIAAHERGVEVRWVTDDEHGIDADEDEGHGQFAMLEDAGIEVIDDGRSALMHNKFIIFDDELLWTGSTNLSQNDNFRNNNNVIVIASPEMAAIYTREFEEMWGGEFGPTSTSTVDQQFVTIEDTDIQVMFAAEDDVEPYIVNLINDAQESIYFMAFSFTSTPIGDAMLARAEAGVEVAGIFETRGSETEFSELPVLYCAGQAVRQDGNPGTFHHKVIVIDEGLVITGSFNFSQNATSSNDENALIIGNAEIAAQYLAEFSRRWAEARDPDPADITCP